jgi:hypothetical protein
MMMILMIKIIKNSKRNILRVSENDEEPREFEIK